MLLSSKIRLQKHQAYLSIPIFWWLQLLAIITALGQQCYATQIITLFACMDFKETSTLEESLEILTTLPSQSHLFLQLRTADSVARILQNLCHAKRLLHQMSFTNYEQLGQLALDFQPGVLAMQRGEEGLIWLCRLTEATPTSNPEGLCFN